MRSIFKWGIITVGGFAVLLVLILLLVPLFVDINDYKPQIVKAAKQATGRDLVLGGDLSLSLFPWAGVAVNDVLLGSPEGFKEKEFVHISKFEARMKLVPLLFKDIQVKHVVLKGFQLTLVQQKDGRTNWDFSSADKKSMPGKKKESAPSSDQAAPGGLSLKALSVGQIAVTNGVVKYIDHAKNTKNEVSDVTLMLEEISLDKPIQLSFSAKIDGKPVSLKGTAGPIGEEPGKGTIGFDLIAIAFEAVELNVAGKVTEPMSSPTYQFKLKIPTFSPKQLLAKIDEKTVPQTKDPKVLTRAGMTASFMGDTRQVSLTEGQFVLDDSTLSFQGHAKEFEKPNIRWSVQIDKIDLDRYLLKAEDKKAAKTSKAPAVDSPTDGSKTTQTKSTKTDYAPLRKLLMDGNLGINELKAGGATIQELQMKLSAKGGQVELKPLTLNLYKGKMAANGLFDVRTDTPKTTLSLSAQDIQAGAMVVDMFQKGVVEGTVRAEVSLSMVGDQPEQIKKTLNGSADLMLKDGAIKGVDLGAMLQNVQAAFGKTGKTDAATQTEFAEFHSLFKIVNGVAETDYTILKSPVMTAKATGMADLNKETLKFRLEPTYVDITRQDKEGKHKTSSLVPVLISGTFSSPKFQPDLEGVVKQRLEKELTNIFEKRRKDKKSGEGETEGDTKEKADPVEEAMKGLIKQFPLGR